MKTTFQLVAAAMAVGLFSAAAMADGFIVPWHPIHPPPHFQPIPIRGSWAVKYHHVDITVRDQVASVSIDQEFVNTSSGMMEVEYFFPVPPGAAIDSMTLIVNGKEFSAKLLKADEARKIYEDIVRKKRDPALLEYVGFGLIKTSAFPLEPNKPAKVVVNYKNVCHKDNGLVEVWYPLNTEKFSSKPIEDISVRVDIKSPTDITAVYSPSHDLKVERKDARQVIASYTAKETRPTTDFQVFYKAADEEVGATLLTHQGAAGKDGHFMLLASPNPKAARKPVPKDVVIVLDHSGSMSSDRKLVQVREALSYILKNLNPDDRFNVVSFSDDIEPFFDNLVKADEAKVKDACDRLDRIEPRGGTNLHEALLRAMKMIGGRKDGEKSAPAYVIFLTDGLPTVGNTNEIEILKDVAKANTCEARLFAFGVGYDVNVRLLDKLVSENRGKSDYVKPKEPIEGKITALYNKIKNPVMTNLKLRIEGLRIRDNYPRDLGDLFEGDQLVVVGRYFGEDIKKLAREEAGVSQTNLVITGVFEGKDRAFEYPVKIVEKDDRYGFVEKLWAIRRVGYLLDQIQFHGSSQELIDEVVQLSKEYGIMTPYTSFLADEGTPLTPGHHREVLRRATAAADKLDRYEGASGQLNAMNRQALNEAKSLAAPAAAARSFGGSGGGGGVGQPVATYGYSGVADYEQKKEQAVNNVRNVNNQALYKRGQVWMTPEAAKLDPAKDADKIKEVTRYSDEYFALVGANSVAENQLLASQQEGEELMVSLRGQVYRIK